uniref:DNA damage inducible transcript 3 n=1 Tax=Leptobrachium leishanense TaxID=445787 RepID=A0A8C5N3U2_9ANUR
AHSTSPSSLITPCAAAVVVRTIREQTLRGGRFGRERLSSFTTTLEGGLIQVETLDNTSFQWTFETIDSPLSVEFSQEDVVALEAVVDKLPSDEILEFINPGTLVSTAPPESRADHFQGGASEPEPCYSSSPSQTLTEDEESSTSSCGTKRKRNSKARGGKIRVKERDQDNDRKVDYFIAENERLKVEIERLTVEVEKTRKDLIERMVTTRRPQL